MGGRKDWMRLDKDSNGRHDGSDRRDGYFGHGMKHQIQH
jgi:hypothetical protein